MVVLCKLAYEDNPHLNGFDYVLIRATTMLLLAIGQVSYMKVNVLDVKKGYKLLLLFR